MEKVRELFTDVYGIDPYTVSLEHPWELKGNILSFTKLYILEDEDSGKPYTLKFGEALFTAPVEREVPTGYLGAVAQFIRTQWNQKQGEK